MGLFCGDLEEVGLLVTLRDDDGDLVVDLEPEGDLDGDLEGDTDLVAVRVSDGVRDCVVDGRVGFTTWQRNNRWQNQEML